jgi:CRISPR-associated endonuclease Cas3-HD
MWAHSANEEGNRHALVDHLHGTARRGTARLAQQFAEPFGGGDAAFFAGLAHDAGKASCSWQEGLLRVEADRGRVGVDHKTLGVHLAGARQAGLLQRVLHGHHGGLTNPEVVRCSLRDNDDADGRRRRIEAEAALRELVPELFDPSPVHLPQGFHGPLEQEFLIRLLFSCLVDADGLRILSERFGTTVLLASATQPELWALGPLRDAAVRDVIADPAPLYRSLRRARYQWWLDPKPTLEQVARRIAEHPQALVVVNAVRNARTVFETLRAVAGEKVAVRHLSTAMCAQLRRAVQRSRSRERIAMVILDNLGIHTPKGSRLLRALLAELGEQLVLVYTPTYDPDANRIEWLWRALRRTVTHTHRRQTLVELVDDGDRWARTITPAQVLSQIGSPFALDQQPPVGEELNHAA